MAPFEMCAPESRLPVCAGWMPWPVSAFTNRPSITLIFCFSGSSSSSVLLSFMIAPEPSALQCSSLMPLPRNTTAEALGEGGVAVVVSAKAGSDCSQGRAMVTPAPRSTARREILREVMFIHLSLSSGSLGVRTSLVQELRAGDDRLHQFGTICSRSPARRASMRSTSQLVGELQRAVQRIRQQFAAEVIHDTRSAGVRGRSPEWPRIRRP